MSTTSKVTAGSPVSNESPVPQVARGSWLNGVGNWITAGISS